MNKKRRGYGEGAIVARGENAWLLRYRLNGKRLAKTVHGTKSEAQKELTALRHAVNRGQHVDPDKMTVCQWVEHWIKIGCPGNKRRKQVGDRSIERYAQLLRCHVLPTLGDRRLQQLQASEIDSLYVKLGEEKKVSARTALHVHRAFAACLGVATRTGKIASNPMLKVEKIPAPGEADHGMALEEEELLQLVQGFKDSPIFPIVAVAAFTGARRNEVLALRWCDLDLDKKTLRIERAIEETKIKGLFIKGPKREEHKRTIAIDDDTIALLLTIRDQHLRIVAGVSDGATVDLSLVKHQLPPNALIFPGPPAPGESFSLTKLRDPHSVTKEFVRRTRRLGFPGLRFHDLRGTHETHLLDAGMSPAAVAQRCGHDPMTMLRSYAKRTKKADARAAEIIGLLSRGALK